MDLNEVGKMSGCTVIRHIIQKISDYGSIVVMLLPARCDTYWFHQYLYKTKGVKIEFLRGRLRFDGDYGKNTAPFPSLVAIIKPATDMKR